MSVVDLLGDPRRSLTRDRTEVQLHSGRRHGETEKARDKLGIGEVVTDRSGDAGLLDLDDDISTVAQRCPVDLANGGRSQRFVVEVREMLYCRTKFGA